MDFTTTQINLFKSLFRGRNDVYAIRREKEGKSIYMPAYKVDWSDFEKYKAAGGLFNTYKKKEQIPFGVDAIISHLSGKETIGYRAFQIGKWRPLMDIL